MAKKDAMPADSGYQIFTKPGTTKDRVAINFANGMVVETAGAGQFFIFAAGGSKHAILSDSTLEELIGQPAPETEAASE